MTERNAPGAVRDAILTVLQERDEPATISEIHKGVVMLLGEEIPSSSVRSYLSLNEGTAFNRTGRGQYALPDVARREADRDDFGPPDFEFGCSRLYLGNAFHWFRCQPANSIEAIVTDPPYGLVEYSPIQQAKLRSGHGGVWRIPPSFDGHVRSPLPRFTTLTDRDLRELELFFLNWAQAALPVLVPGAHVVIASNPLVSFLVANAIVRAGFERRGEIVRLVMTMRGGDRPKNAHEEFSEVTVMPRSMWEPWLVFRKPPEGRVQDNLRRWRTGALRRPSAERPFGDVIPSHPTRPSERKLAPHPSLKPQHFLRQIVRAVLPLGEGTVLDPFAGSGSTLAACEAVGYASVGVELDPKYVEMAHGGIPSLAAFHVSLGAGKPS